MLPPGCCSRCVWSTRSTSLVLGSLLARAPIVVCSRGSQQKYCVHCWTHEPRKRLVYADLVVYEARNLKGLFEPRYTSFDLPYKEILARIRGS